MSDFNDIGISRELDWPRIKKLLTIGLFASVLHLAGDLILGWGVEDDALEGMLSAYTSTSDSGLFAAALLGLFGVVLEGLACFGVYRLMAAKSPKYAHRCRSGIFGYLMFCACGFHVPVCTAVFLMKHGLSEALLTQYSAYFLMPPLVLFWIFFFVLVMTQIVAFRKGLTPYRCCVFSMAFGMLVRVFSRGAARQPAAWQRPALRVARHRQRLDVRRAARDDEKSAASVRQGRRPHGKPTL